jgi:hypothetical protein
MFVLIFVDLNIFTCMHLCSCIMCCHVNLNIFTCVHLVHVKLIIVYVCTWIIIVDFICILNRYIKNNDSMLEKVILVHFEKLLILSNLKNPYNVFVVC